MQIFTKNDKLNINTVLALGNFDGLHLAHQEIIRRCAAYGKEHRMASGVLLFLNHTGEMTGNGVQQLTTFEEKTAILEKMGIDFVYAVPFDEAMRKKTPAEFVAFLQERLTAKAVSVGYNYRYGFQAAGNVETLQASDIDVLVTEPVYAEGAVVSSSRIRELLLAGDVAMAAKLLGRPYCMTGTVDSGLQNGRKMGLPTANLAYPPEKLLPADGVYKAVTYVQGVGYKSAVNIGKNPTFDAEKRTVESFILQFAQNIYTEEIRIELIDRIRAEKKFRSPEALRTQIQKDIQKAGEES